MKLIRFSERGEKNVFVIREGNLAENVLALSLSLQFGVVSVYFSQRLLFSTSNPSCFSE